jgi:hypothetical protein
MAGTEPLRGKVERSLTLVKRLIASFAAEDGLRLELGFDFGFSGVHFGSGRRRCVVLVCRVLHFATAPMLLDICKLFPICQRVVGSNGRMGCGELG